MPALQSEDAATDPSAVRPDSAQLRRDLPTGVRIAVINQKGGVGKTTITQNLALALANKGCRCLLADLDR